MMRVLSVKGLSLGGLVALAFAVLPGTAAADDPYGLAPGSTSTFSAAPATWGARPTTPADATSISKDAPVTRARDMLSRARFLDEAAIVDEKAATELASHLSSLRAAAKTARDRADRATPEDRELLGARAEDLETDVIISEADVMFRRKTAADNRRLAHELRLRAVRVIREPPHDVVTSTDDSSAFACDPPFRFTADGRKVYRVECLK